MDNINIVMRNILVVDPDINVLKQIEHDLKDSGIRVFSSSSGRLGIEILDNEKIDIIFVELEMPDIDGFKFLAYVQSKYPDIDRLILCNENDKITATRAIMKGMASSFIEKPWIGNNIPATIIQLLETREKLRQEELINQIKNIHKLPALPNIYNQLMGAIAAEKSFKQISAIIQQDVTIAAKLLQLANSSIYGFGATSSLTRALMIVGVQALRDIVLTFSIINQLNWSEEQKSYLEMISRHSLIVSKYMAEFYKLKYNKTVPDEFTSVGITHDIGKIIQLQYFSNDFLQITGNMKKNGKTYYENEILLGFHKRTHCEIGAYFLKSWNLPEINSDVSLYHHTPHLAPPNKRELMEIASFVNRFANFIWTQKNNSSWDIDDFTGDHTYPYKELKEIGELMRLDMHVRVEF